MLAGLFLELAAESGAACSLELQRCRALDFPVRGIRLVRSLGLAPVRCRALGGHLLEINWGEGNTFTLDLRRWPTANPPPELEVIPRAAVRGLMVDTSGGFDLGFVADRARPRSPGPLDQRETKVIDTALQFIGLADPRLLDEMLAIRLLLVPLVAQDHLARQSFSVEVLPRVVYCAADKPFELADVLCHEYHHLKLFLVEERYPLLRNPGLPTVVPWRPDMRTARGLLHGTYVFYSLTSTFGKLFAKFPPSEAGARKLAVWIACVDRALVLLDSLDWQPTSMGSRLVENMRVGNEAAMKRLDVATGGLSSAAISEVDAHLSQAGRTDSLPPAYVGY